MGVFIFVSILLDNKPTLNTKTLKKNLYIFYEKKVRKKFVFFSLFRYNFME